MWVRVDENGVEILGPFAFGNEWFNVTVTVYGDGRWARYQRRILSRAPLYGHDHRFSPLPRSTGEEDIGPDDVERVSAAAWATGFLYEDLTGLNCYRQLSERTLWGCVED